MPSLDDVYTMSGAEVGMLKYLFAECAAMAGSNGIDTSDARQETAERSKRLAYALIEHCRWDGVQVELSVDTAQAKVKLDCGCAEYIAHPGVYLLCEQHLMERAES